MSADEMNFDLTPKQVIIRMKANNDTTITYVLKEATGDAATKWQNKMFAATKLGPEGKPTAIGNMADIEPYLLSMCLFLSNVDGAGNIVNVSSSPVPEKTIRDFPADVVSKLYNKVLSISGLKKKKDKETLQKEIDEATEQLSKYDSEREDSAKN